MANLKTLLRQQELLADGDCDCWRESAKVALVNLDAPEPPYEEPPAPCPVCGNPRDEMLLFIPYRNSEPDEPVHPGVYHKYKDLIEEMRMTIR